MESRVKAVGHAVHPMLIVFPLGLLSTAVVFDILHLVTDRGGFTVAAAYTIAAGIVGALVAAVFGLIDWLAIPAGTRAKWVGTMHGVGNVVVVALSVVTAWLGGELVERLGVGVDGGAGLDAPSSLSHRRAGSVRHRPA